MSDSFKTYVVGGQLYKVKKSESENSCIGCVAFDDKELCGKLNADCDADHVIVKARHENTETENSGTGKKYDQSKNRYDLVPAKALDEAVKVLTRGADKYNEAFGDENWRKLENPKRRYYGALMRHLQAVRMGETHDPETGIHHYAHAMTNLMFLLEMELDSDYKNIKGWS